MGDFGLFEADAHAQAEPERQARHAANKLAGAIDEVRQQYGSWLTAATGIDEFDDRWNAARHDIRQTVAAHVPPVSGVMRRVKNAMKADFKRTADLPTITTPSMPSVPGGAAGAVAGAADAMANQAAPGAATATNPGQSDGTTPGHLGRVAQARKEAGFATYRTAADCVIANSDKDDPHAYCAYIKHQTGPKVGSANFREVEAGLRRELSRNDLMAAFTELGDLPIKLAGQDGDEPELHTHSTFEDHQGEELIPDGDFQDYLGDVSQGAPAKVDRNFGESGDSGSDRRGYRQAIFQTWPSEEAYRRSIEDERDAERARNAPPVAPPKFSDEDVAYLKGLGQTPDQAGGGFPDWESYHRHHGAKSGEDISDQGKRLRDHDDDYDEKRKEVNSSLAVDLYTDWATSNGLRVASVDTLQRYAQTGIPDSDYYEIEARIRQAELPPTLTMGYGAGGFDPQQEEELAALAQLEADIRGSAPGGDEPSGGGGGFGGGDDEDSDSDSEDEGDDEGQDDEESDDDFGGDEGGDFGGDDSDHLDDSDGCDFFGGGDDDSDDEGGDDQESDDEGDSEDDEGDDEGDEDEGDSEDDGGGDDGPDDDDDGGPPWITSSHERVQLARDMQWALKADRARLAAEEDPQGGAGAPQQPAAPAGPPQVPDVSSGAPAGTPEPTENQPQEDALLDTALQAVMQMVDRETQEYQTIIDPLQQAVQAIQFAQQVEQSEHPLDVTPPEGTVDATPSAAPGGTQDLQQQQVQAAMRHLQAACDREKLPYPAELVNHLQLTAQVKRSLNDARLAKEISYARAIPQLTRIAKAYGMPKRAVKTVLEAMGRKHYQAVSDAIATLPPEHRTGIAASLADMFAEDNPRFVHQHFFTAAGVPQGGGAAPFVRSAALGGGEHTAAGSNWTLTPELDTYHFPNAKPPVPNDNIDVNNLPGTSKSGNPKAAATEHEAKDVVEQYQNWSKGQAAKGLNLGDDVNLSTFATQHKVGPKALNTLKTQLGVGVGTPSGGQPRAPKTKAASFFQRRVPGWTWDDHLNGYITSARRDFECSCGEPVPTPSYGVCKCGKIWNSYAIGGTDHLANNSAEMFVAREIPVRDGVVLANADMAAGRPAFHTAAVRPLAASDADWDQWNAHALQNAPERDMRSVFHDREDDRFTPRGEIIQAAIGEDDHEVTYRDGERYCSKCDALLWDPNVHHCPAKQASVHQADWTVYDDDVPRGGPDRPPSTSPDSPPADWARRGPEKGPSSQWVPPIFRSK